MALIYTPEAHIGSPCPNFQLNTVDESTLSLKELSHNKAIVFLFICNHCPYVQAIEDRIVDLAHKMSDKNIPFVGICSNDANDYPDDNRENLLKRWKEKNYNFPYLHDEEQKMAKDFGAVCTPDIFVYNFQNRPEGELYYRGRLDDSWKDPLKVKKQELYEALQGLLNQKPPPTESVPSMGCSIKWINS